MSLPLVFDAPTRGLPPRHLADLDVAERKAAVVELGEKAFRAEQLSRHYFAGRSLVRTFEGDGGAYAPTIAKVMATFNERRGNYSSSESLGVAIHGAVTDGSKKMCYVVGEDAIGLLAVRQQAGDEAFAAGLTQRFGLGQG